MIILILTLILAITLWCVAIAPSVRAANSLLTPETLLFILVATRVLPPLIFPISSNAPDLHDLGYLVAICVVLGATLGHVAALLTSRAQQSSSSVTQQHEIKPEPRFTVGEARVLGLCVVAGVVFFGGSIPALDASLNIFLSGAEEAKYLTKSVRTELTKGSYFGAEYRGQGLHSAVQYYGWSILVAAAVVRLGISRGGLISWLLLCFVFCGAWLFVGGDGSRGPFLRLGIVALIAWSLCRKVKYIHLATVAAGIFVASLGMSLYSSKGAVVMTGEKPATHLASKMAHRMFYGNGEGDLFTIDLIEDGSLSRGWGAYSTTEFLNSIPGYRHDLPLAHNVYTLASGDFDGTTFLSGTAVSLAYADFGLFGVLLTFLLSGFVATNIRCRYFSSTRSVQQLVTLTLLMDYVSRTAIVGFATFFQGLAILILMCFLYALMLPAPNSIARVRL